MNEFDLMKDNIFRLHRDSILRLTFDENLMAGEEMEGKIASTKETMYIRLEKLFSSHNLDYTREDFDKLHAKWQRKNPIKM